MVSDLENKQKTVLGVALPEESECLTPSEQKMSLSDWIQSIKYTRDQTKTAFAASRIRFIHAAWWVLLRLCIIAGMKKELQTLREEIKTLASQIQRKLKSECVAFVLFNVHLTRMNLSWHHLSLCRYRTQEGRRGRGWKVRSHQPSDAADAGGCCFVCVSLRSLGSR